MSRRAVVAIALALTVTPGLVAGARAQEATPVPYFAVATAPEFRSVLAVAPQLGELQQLPMQPIERPTFEPTRLARRQGPSPLMASLYATTAVMQALDVHSTLAALDAGGVEANPVMAGLTKNRAAFIATKAAVAAASILAAREMAKRNKVAAALTLVAINSAYAWVAHHNYQVAHAGQ